MMQYPLREKIGAPDLFVGREREMREYGKWLSFIPKQIAKSRVILARRKSGKTAFVQRIFNQLWSANGMVIPFYIDIAETRIWLLTFALNYFRAFASQYISFLERDPGLVSQRLTLSQIKAYGQAHGNTMLVDDVDSILWDQKMGLQDSVWYTAYSAPHRFADHYDQRILVIIDEFQNLAGYVYRDEACERAHYETMPGSFHSFSESKIAPMLVTGSYVGWLMEIAGKYLQAGRLKNMRMSPYLTPAEGLQAVYKYAEVFNEPITNHTAAQINALCMADPFFISCVMQSNYPDRDLTTSDGVVNTVNYEITDRSSEMSKTWAEYIELTLQRINDQYAKAMLLHLTKHADRYWSTYELKDVLGLELSSDKIKEKLLLMVESDVIEWGTSDIRFRGLQDGTLNLILRHRFEEEIEGELPDLKPGFREQITRLEKDKRSLQGKLNDLVGEFAEFQLLTEFRARKRFSLADFFSGVTDVEYLEVVEARQRVAVIRQTDRKRFEIDLVVVARDGRALLVEVRKRKTKTGLQAVDGFLEKAQVYAVLFPGQRVRLAFLSLGGFTDEAMQLCEHEGIGMATEIRW